MTGHYYESNSVSSANIVSFAFSANFFLRKILNNLRIFVFNFFLHFGCMCQLLLRRRFLWGNDDYGLYSFVFCLYIFGCVSKLVWDVYEETYTCRIVLLSHDWPTQPIISERKLIRRCSLYWQKPEINVRRSLYSSTIWWEANKTSGFLLLAEK